MEGEEAGGEVPGAFAGEGGDFRRGGGWGGIRKLKMKRKTKRRMKRRMKMKRRGRNRHRHWHWSGA